MLAPIDVECVQCFAIAGEWCRLSPSAIKSGHASKPDLHKCRLKLARARNANPNTHIKCGLAAQAKMRRERNKKPQAAS